MLFLFLLFFFLCYLIFVVRAALAGNTRNGGGDNNAWDVGEVEVAQHVLGLLVNGNFDNIKFRVLRYNVVLPLALLFLKLERNATHWAPVEDRKLQIFCVGLVN